MSTRIASLTETTYVKLREEILSCRLRPGSKVKMDPICKALDVSLGVVREALTRLAAEGLLRAEAQRGFLVPPIDKGDLRKLTEARIEIECLCLRKSIEEGDLAWEGRVAAAFHHLSGLPDRYEAINDDWSNAHATFHSVLVDGGSNPWFLKLRGLLFDQSERYRRLSVSLQPRKRNLLKEHRGLTDATLGRDADEACRQMRAHLALTMQIILDGGFCDTDAAVAVNLARNEQVRTGFRRTHTKDFS
jgi:DNA-binding GntR family transcriptional regulator